MEILEFFSVEDRERARKVVAGPDVPFATFRGQLYRHPELEKLCMVNTDQMIRLDIAGIDYIKMTPDQLKQRSSKAYDAYQRLRTNHVEK